jgi:hypothetical protein
MDEEVWLTVARRNQWDRPLLTVDRRRTGVRGSSMS